VIDLLSCKSNCGTNRANACVFEFQITQRYAGDNYRVYFWVPNTNWTIGSATITAWKRIFIEQDKMCRRGGMLWEDPTKEPDALPNDQAILISKYNGVRVDNLQLGDKIDIFDADKPFNQWHDKACVIGIDDTSSPDFVTIALGQVINGACTGNNYSLLQGYDGSVPNPQPPKAWDFTIGKSAGVCVEGSGYYEANTSQLNRRNNITGPFDDAFVSFKMPNNNAAGVIPYLPQNWFDTGTANDRARFSKIWFENFINASGGSPPLDKYLFDIKYIICYNFCLLIYCEVG
jgi:hypothetical protein